jgi:hypothetical protein
MPIDTDLNALTLRDALENVSVTLRTESHSKPDIYVDINLEQTYQVRATAFMAAMISSPHATAEDLRDVDGLARKAVDYAKALRDAELRPGRSKQSESMKLNAELKELLNEAEDK